MKSVGLIVEYNPFHNGHLHHLTQSKALTHADVVIVVMSGHFTQRGEPTVVSKWQRTQMALHNGADLVIELPYVYSTQHASLFAHGAVSILNHLHVDSLVFGSECGDLNALHHLHSIKQSNEFKALLTKHLSNGHNVPRASELALKTLHGDTFKAMPNDTLGLYYLEALQNMQSDIIPFTIKRVHNDYHDTTPQHHLIASATSIRQLRQNKQSFDSYVPESVATLLKQDATLSETIHDFEHYFSFLKQTILTLRPEHLSTIHDITEGLEYRLYDAMLTSSSFEQFLNLVKTKRYTRTRIQRICAHILTHTTKDFVAHLTLSNPVPYLRVLGTTPAGRAYLKRVKHDVTVPIYSTFNAKASPMLHHELAVTAAYSAILSPHEANDLIQQEFKQFPLHVEAF